MAGLFKIDWTNVKSAVVYGLLTMLVAGLDYIAGLGDIGEIHAHSLLNIVLMSGTVFFVSLIKNFLTTSSGNFLGITKVIPSK